MKALDIVAKTVREVKSDMTGGSDIMNFVINMSFSLRKDSRPIMRVLDEMLTNVSGKRLLISYF